MAISWAIHESSSEAGGLPAVYLLKSLIPLMACLLLLQGLSIVLNSLLVLLQPAKQDNQQGGSHD